MKNSFLLLPALLGILLSAGCDQLKEKFASAPKAPAKPNPMRAMMTPVVSVDSVVALDEGAVKESIGYIEAIQSVQIQPRVQGFLEKISFTEGSTVNKGDLLAEIEDVSYRALAAAAQAVVNQNEAELTFAKSNYQRQKQLLDNNAGTASALDEAQRLVDFQTAKLNESRAKYLDAITELQYTRMTAPISGRLGRVKYTVGNYVTAASAPLVEIVQVDPIYLRIYLTEREYQNYVEKADSIAENNINISLRVKLANGQFYSAPWKVAITDNKIDVATGTITLWVEIENKKGILLPGGYVTVGFAERHKQKVPAVAASAILNDDKTAFVYTLGPKNMPVRRNIKAGETVGELVLVDSGLQTGETVIIDGLHKIFPGLPVIPVPAPRQ